MYNVHVKIQYSYRLCEVCDMVVDVHESMIFSHDKVSKYRIAGNFSWGPIFAVFANKLLSTKIGSHEDFPLYGILTKVWVLEISYMVHVNVQVFVRFSLWFFCTGYWSFLLHVSSCAEASFVQIQWFYLHWSPNWRKWEVVGVIFPPVVRTIVLVGILI
jgi:hypothetical protein